jgi:3D (Asp-Asp-Asp) domain-containing protein
MSDYHVLIKASKTVCCFLLLFLFIYGSEPLLCSSPDIPGPNTADIHIKNGASSKNPDGFARYRDFGHLSGLIGNYLSRPRTPFKMSTTTGNYKLTFYWITRECDSRGSKCQTIKVYIPDTGQEIPVEVSKDFKRHLDREGTGILDDGRVINVYLTNSKSRYIDVSQTFPTGMGCRNNPLTPFISIAVSTDNKELKFGDRIYIPEAQGAPLPDGTKHDGLFSVDDTGTGIAPDQIDIFVFIKDNWPSFQKYLKTHRRRFFVYKLFPEHPRKQP